LRVEEECDLPGTAAGDGQLAAGIDGANHLNNNSLQDICEKMSRRGCNERKGL